MTASLARHSLARWHEHTAAEREWDEPVRRTVAPERFKTITADRAYLDMTNYPVTPATFEKEERRSEKMGALEDRSVPPPGLVCSARLGAVEILL